MSVHIVLAETLTSVLGQQVVQQLQSGGLAPVVIDDTNKAEVSAIRSFFLDSDGVLQFLRDDAAPKLQGRRRV